MVESKKTQHAFWLFHTKYLYLCGRKIKCKVVCTSLYSFAPIHVNLMQHSYIHTLIKKSYYKQISIDGFHTNKNLRQLTRKNDYQFVAFVAQIRRVWKSRAHINAPDEKTFRRVFGCVGTHHQLMCCVNEWSNW